MRRLSFALTEVLIAILLVGGALSFFIPSIRGVFHTYQKLKIEATSQYLADEFFANAVLKYIATEKTPDGCEESPISQEAVIKYLSDTYIVHVTFGLDPDEAENRNTQKIPIACVVTVTGAAEDMHAATRRTVFWRTEKE
jgi:hypothetical protein